MVNEIRRVGAIAALGCAFTAAAVNAQNGGSTPDWMAVDDAAKTVTIDIVAGSTGAPSPSCAARSAPVTARYVDRTERALGGAVTL